MARAAKSKRKSYNALPKEEPKIPVSVIVFLIWTGISLVSFLASMISNRVIVGGFFLIGISAFISNLIFASAQGFIFFGTIKRKSWTRPLAVVFYTFLLVQMVLSMVTYQSNPEAYLNFSMPEGNPLLSDPSLSGIVSAATFLALLFAFIFNLVITILVFIMLKRRKNYFSK